MSLLSEAVKTYDHMIGSSCLETEGKEPLAPVGHALRSAQIEITIDKDGQFVEAKAFPPKTSKIVPVTEESCGRSHVKAHPLCDQIRYLTPLGKGLEYADYVKELKKWAESDYATDKVKAVYRYVSGGTILDDLQEAGLLKTKNGEVTNGSDMVCWSVTGLGDKSGPTWEDKELFSSWQDYYQDVLLAGREKDCCFVTGSYEPCASQHLKGIFPLAANAKLISSNDDKNFTFRGRFNTADQAISVGFVTSQKASNALRWVVSNYGSVQGGRVFAVWNPEGVSLPSIFNPLLRRDDQTAAPAEYGEKLDMVLRGYQADFDRENTAGKVLIAGFQAVTPGRLSNTYYRELIGSDFLARLKEWDSTCCWTDNLRGTYSPYLFDIIRYAFGTVRARKDKQNVSVSPEIVADKMQTLIQCRIDGRAFPADIMHAIVNRAGRIFLYKGTNRTGLLFTACAVIRKYRYDHYKEEWDMALDPNCKNRSYQYGRLLAVMEKIEKDALSGRGNGDKDREPNAVRLQYQFTRRPAYAAKNIMEKLKTAYYPRLNAASQTYYEKLIGEIMQMVSTFPMEEYDSPLDETYLLGYYLQKNDLYSRKTAETAGDSEGEEKEAAAEIA